MHHGQYDQGEYLYWDKHPASGYGFAENMLKVTDKQAEKGSSDSRTKEKDGISEEFQEVQLNDGGDGRPSNPIVRSPRFYRSDKKPKECCTVNPVVRPRFETVFPNTSTGSSHHHEEKQPCLDDDQTDLRREEDHSIHSEVKPRPESAFQSISAGSSSNSSPHHDRDRKRAESGEKKLEGAAGASPGHHPRARSIELEEERRGEKPRFKTVFPNTSAGSLHHTQEKGSDTRQHPGDDPPYHHPFFGRKRLDLYGTSDEERPSDLREETHYRTRDGSQNQPSMVCH